ncbi:MAG: glycosyltransferase family 2 protein, partial [Candidatus Bathyarchaeota archaeon]
EERKDVSGVMGAVRNVAPGNVISDFVQRQIMVSEWSGNLGEDGTLLLYLNSANFSINRKCFLEYRFKEDLVSSEDTELFLRLKKNGLKILYEPRAFVQHLHPRTIEDLFKRYVEYGEGLFQVEKLHGEEFRNHYRILAPLRYIDFQDDRLHEAVFSDNRQLCEDCEFDSFQKCRITVPQLIDSKVESELDLHRFVCLAKAVGILKQRTGIDPESILHQIHTNRGEGLYLREAK